MNEVQRKYGQQHEQTACLCEDEKFIGGIPAIAVSPDSNQEIHRYQHYFPKKIKKKKVHGYKHTTDTGQRPQEIKKIEAGFLFDLIP